jgi:hypothetical protein
MLDSLQAKLRNRIFILYAEGRSIFLVDSHHSCSLELAHKTKYHQRASCGRSRHSVLTGKLHGKQLAETFLVDKGPKLDDP